jgi:glycine/D-amino acid oxidase-like deaminating enzyme
VRAAIDRPRVTRNGGVSFWYASTRSPSRRPPLAGDRHADVCIVGAGFTGLWTAYYLKRAAPALDVVLLEREFAGYGASGRNGGWLSDHFAGARPALARLHGREAVLAMERAMQATIDEVLTVCGREGIDADAAPGGLLQVARNPAQLARMRRRLAEDRSWGLREEDIRELGADELRERVRVADALGAAYSPHGVRVQPAKLVQGLADAVERLGVPIYEDTRVIDVRRGRAVTERGTVRSPVVLRCLEGFTASLQHQRRTWLPLNSAMIVTEPLAGNVWSEIGWERAELLGDCAHAYMYSQRTADGRIALGGRGIPYRLGSRRDRDGRTQRATFMGLARLLAEMFPAAASAAIEHTWCGVLGVARDWQPRVVLDRDSGIGYAGGYVGSGVSTTNLAGRTLCDLVLGRDSELVRLAWVGGRARPWEPEPLRWLGVNAVYALYRAADRREMRGRQRTSGLARLGDAIAGRR